MPKHPKHHYTYNITVLYCGVPNLSVNVLDQLVYFVLKEVMICEESLIIMTHCSYILDIYSRLMEKNKVKLPLTMWNESVGRTYRQDSGVRRSNRATQQEEYYMDEVTWRCISYDHPKLEKFPAKSKRKHQKY